MSDEVGSSRGTSGDRARKGKQIMYSDDDQKQTEQRNPSSVPSGLNDEDLSIFHMFSERDGTSLDVLIKQQQQAFQRLDQVSNPLQNSAKGESSQKEISADPKDIKKFDDSYFDPFGSDSEDEEIQSLIFELEILESDRLVIPNWMMDGEFPLLTLHPDREETLQLTDDHGKKWNVTLNYENTLNSYVITTGWSSYLQHYHLKSQDLIRCYRHVPQLNSNHFRILHQKSYGDAQYLFKVVVSRSNRLRIFFDRVVGHFSFLEALSPPNHLSEYTIYVTDYLNQTWEMRLLHFDEEEAYVVIRGWEQYVARHDLRHKDKIVFCRPNHSTDRNRFLIYHELGGKLGSDDHLVLPLFLPENIICKLRLSKADVGFGRLIMPAVEIPSLCRNRDMVKLTDENDKEWFMIMVQVEEGYMIIDGWEGYVKEYELEAGDIVRLYNPACADHDNHYLIECEKKKQKRTEKEEGDGAAPSQGGSRKGKEKLGTL